MLAKLWSQDRKIKKLASFSTFDELKKKAVEQGVCPSGPNEDVKASKQSYRPDSVQIFYLDVAISLQVFLEDGTEVEETVFQCLLESSIGQLGGVFIVSTSTSIGVTFVIFFECILDQVLVWHSSELPSIESPNVPFLWVFIERWKNWRN